MANTYENVNLNEKLANILDVIIVGAGFSGLYMLHQLRQRGYSVKILDVAGGVGGTWYWNRYPGARCDIESMQYSFSFSEELRNEWSWSEVFAPQREILRYLNYFADKFDLRKDIHLETRVTNATFDETNSRWTIHTDRADCFSAKFCIMATGCLSAARIPDVKGLDCFKGKYYHTGQWPHEGVDFTNHRVAVIGTGSSGIQSIPIIAGQANHLFVLQRTPNFSIPSRNRPLNAEDEQWWRSNYAEHHRKILETPFGFLPRNDDIGPSINISAEERLKIFETHWELGGLNFLVSFTDLLINKETNDIGAEFVRNKIRQVIDDPAVAESVIPTNGAIGAKRLCVDTNYYQTFNRDNVTLVDLRKGSIDEIIENGIRIGEKIYEVDDIVFATGFDAMTGALLKIDVRGRSGITLRDKWVAGPRTYLGIMIADFPNLFTITGPGSPSVLTNMVPSIEQHVDWIAECLDYIQIRNYATIEATKEAEDAWVKHVNEVSQATLFHTVRSWYTGENIEGKPKVFMPYPGGFQLYRQKCQEIVDHGYQGFIFEKNSSI